MVILVVTLIAITYNQKNRENHINSKAYKVITRLINDYKNDSDRDNNCDTQ
jgi:hypothetical protein